MDSAPNEIICARFGSLFRAKIFTHEVSKKYYIADFEGIVTSQKTKSTH